MGTYLAKIVIGFVRSRVLISLVKCTVLLTGTADSNVKETKQTVSRSRPTLQVGLGWVSREKDIHGPETSGLKSEPVMYVAIMEVKHVLVSCRSG